MFQSAELCQCQLPHHLQIAIQLPDAPRQRGLEKVGFRRIKGCLVTRTLSPSHLWAVALALE